MEEIDGVRATDGLVKAWAEEAERGYDEDWLRRRGRKESGDGRGGKRTDTLPG